MTVSELLAAIRKPYAYALSLAIGQSAAHAEPALRRADGALATEGRLDLPCRADAIARYGPQAGQSLSVDSDSRLSFEPLSFGIGDTTVSLGPFVWDEVPLSITSVSEVAVPEALKAWFLDWFDAEDENPPLEDGLFGVVHFMSDPIPSGSSWAVTLDLGSAPAQALEDLMFRLADAGVEQIRVG